MMAHRLKGFGLICFIGIVVTVTLMIFTSKSAQTISGEMVATTPTYEAAVYLPSMMLDPTPTPACIPHPEIASSDPENEATILSGINQQRSLNNLSLLSQASELVQSARRHSLDMATNNFTSHTGSDGSQPWERVHDACYDWVAAGEIIGWGFGGNTASMINWWMNSPPHRAIILSHSFEDFGSGYIRNEGSEWGHYWTVNFGRRASQRVSVLEELYVCEYTVEGEFGGSSLILLSTEPCVDYDP